MSTIGHNHAPLEDRIFDDPSVSVDDVLAAVAARIERQNKPRLEELADTATRLSGNEPKLPETFTQAEVKIGLNLLAHLEGHAESATVAREDVVAAAEKFVAGLKLLCKPLDEGLSGLEKTLRARITACMEREIDAHNAERTEGEDKMTCLTLRGSSGAKATLTDNEEIVVEDLQQLPREFLVPDPKLIAAALKAGKNVPGVGKKRKTSLRISCK